MILEDNEDNHIDAEKSYGSMTAADISFTLICCPEHVKPGYQEHYKLENKTGVSCNAGMVRAICLKIESNWYKQINNDYNGLNEYKNPACIFKNS